MVIRDVQVKGGYIVHMGSVEGTIRVGDKMNLLVDTVSTIMYNSMMNMSSFILFPFITLLHKKSFTCKCFLSLKLFWL